MYCFVILLLFNEMQMSVRRFSAIPHLRAIRECIIRAKLYIIIMMQKIV